MTKPMVRSSEERVVVFQVVDASPLEITELKGDHRFDPVDPGTEVASNILVQSGGWQLFSAAFGKAVRDQGTYLKLRIT